MPKDKLQKISAGVLLELLLVVSPWAILIFGIVLGDSFGLTALWMPVGMAVVYLIAFAIVSDDV